MPRFRKRPVVVEAVQWWRNGDHPDDYTRDREGTDSHGRTHALSAEACRDHLLEGDVVRYFRRPDVPPSQPCKHCRARMHAHGWIDTLEGGHIVCPGDFVITGVKGERYPCKPDIFDATYEPAD